MEPDSRRALLTLLGLACVPLQAFAQEHVRVQLVAWLGRRAKGPDVVHLKKGDTLSLTVTSDAADELHLHGYDLRLRLLPGRPASLTVVATLTGRFSAELHNARVELTTLQIDPR